MREDANSFGVESGGPWQVRGNGNLALTDDELLFAQWVPNRWVSWTTEVGDRDSIALWNRDLDGWLAALGGPS